MDTDSSLSNRIDQMKGSLECVSREIARLQQINAMLIIARCGEELTDEEADAWDAVLDWAYEELDFDSLCESMPEHFKSGARRDEPAAILAPAPSEPSAGKRQHQLFPDLESTEASDTSRPPHVE